MAAPGVINFFMKFVVFILFCCLQVFECDSEFEGLYHLPIEHSFDQGPDLRWTKRGVITIRSISNNMAQHIQAQPITDEEAQILKDLAGTGGVYRVRVPVSLESGGSAKTPEYVMGFIKACSLYESSLSDHILLNAASSGTNVLGISLTSAQVTCSGGAARGRLGNWNTSVEIRQTVPGPMPDTVSYIQKIEKEKIAKAKGEQGDNRSFIAKYWMYIVPVVILMMVASSADQGQQ